MTYFFLNAPPAMAGTILITVELIYWCFFLLQIPDIIIAGKNIYK